MILGSSNRHQGRRSSTNQHVAISSGVNINQEDLDSSNFIYDDDFEEIEEEQKNNY